MIFSAAILAITAAAQQPAKPSLVAVHFQDQKAELTPAGREILDVTAEFYRTHNASIRQIILSGHTDRHGDDAANVGLSQRRANNVREYLVAGGVPAPLITTQAFGESRPLVETEDGVKEPANNRVELTFGTGSGW